MRRVLHWSFLFFSFFGGTKAAGAGTRLPKVAVVAEISPAPPRVTAASLSGSKENDVMARGVEDAGKAKG